MRSFVVLLVLASVAATTAQNCVCNTMKWATCDGSPCECKITIADQVKQTLECAKLIPKCFLMKAEMYRAKKGLSTRSGGKPTDHAFVDNDGIYDPDCEANGVFKAKQCNNSDICWCVNSAGVRRTDKGGLDLKCEKLVETVWMQTQLKHTEGVNLNDEAKLKSAIVKAIVERYSVDDALVTEVKYDKDSRTILVDLKKGASNVDIATVGYYMEKDIKVLPLFYNDSKKFSPSVDSKNVTFENILVYYVDAEPPTFTMKRLTAGVVAVIVVVVLAIVAGLVVLFISRKREKSAMYQKAEQTRELDEIQKEQLTSS
ncbi:tumor-associated calcium signal transducer 2-like [Acipenser oxyrinchus oxyrinchus]|uniref:Tumor-associated calcium signal transducer 2-like n=1 Tax=Acipenser oxyrinchus oxyrinchus TaxID=40147 RepID=A0AAD8LMV0_ACIOX|nr:tumor-associated calcium signal transducer 2-like [Acipenser oxyrinchus oxyrinchus]